MSRFLLLLFLGLSPGCGPPAQDDDDDDGWDARADCDDDDPDVNPGAEERCNAEDDDCDGLVDEDLPLADDYYTDDDCDGWGGEHVEPTMCAWYHDPEWYDGVTECTANRGGDCDDGDWDISPGEDESCDGVDDDCDGVVDGTEDGPSFWADADGDGYGDPAVPTTCEGAGASFADNDADCDDSLPSVAPGVAEVCGNGVDDDCSAETSDACGYALVSLDAARVRVDGADAGSAFGEALAAAGDVDGDGVADLVVGAPAGDADDAAWVVAVASGAADAVGARIAGEDPDDLTGWAVAAYGDADGDGRADVAVGAPSAGDGGEGALLVRFGPVVDACEPYCDGARRDGEDAGDRAGQSVLGPGDLDGDGVGDLVVGAPGRDGGGAYVLLGVPTGLGALADADGRIGSGATGSPGTSLVATGDVDGDGLADLGIVDAATGTAWIVAGAGAGETSLDDAWARLEAPTVAGSLAVGDLDGDGVADAVFSAVRVVDTFAWGAFGPLAGTWVLDDAAGLTFSRAAGNARSGATVALGDVDGDGASDLLFAADEGAAEGAASAPGSVYVLAGPLGPGGYPMDAATTRIAGPELSSARVAVGDLDGDGAAEILVGAPEAGDGRGAVFVFGL